MSRAIMKERAAHADAKLVQHPMAYDASDSELEDLKYRQSSHIGERIVVLIECWYSTRIEAIKLGYHDGTSDMFGQPLQDCRKGRCDLPLGAVITSCLLHNDGAEKYLTAINLERKFSDQFDNPQNVVFDSQEGYSPPRINHLASSFKDAVYTVVQRPLQNVEVGSGIMLGAHVTYVETEYCEGQVVRRGGIVSFCPMFARRLDYISKEFQIADGEIIDGRSKITEVVSLMEMQGPMTLNREVEFRRSSKRRVTIHLDNDTLVHAYPQRPAELRIMNIQKGGLPIDAWRKMAFDVGLAFDKFGSCMIEPEDTDQWRLLDQSARSTWRWGPTEIPDGEVFHRQLLQKRRIYDLSGDYVITLLIQGGGEIKLECGAQIRLENPHSEDLAIEILKNDTL